MPWKRVSDCVQLSMVHGCTFLLAQAPVWLLFYHCLRRTTLTAVRGLLAKTPTDFCCKVRQPPLLLVFVCQLAVSQEICVKSWLMRMHKVDLILCHDEAPYEPGPIVRTPRALRPWNLLGPRHVPHDPYLAFASTSSPVQRRQLYNPCRRIRPRWLEHLHSLCHGRAFRLIEFTNLVATCEKS